MIDNNNYKTILKEYLNKEIRTKDIVQLAGTENLIKRHKKDKKISGKDRDLLIRKLSKFCDIKVLGKGKFLICNIYDSINTKIRHTNHPLYKIYHGIKQRCYNFNSTAYKNYGGRGILMGDDWLDDYYGIDNFITQADNNGYIPNKNLSIDRIDVNGNYEPSNCRWVDNKAQIINRRSSKGEILSEKDYIIQNIDGIYLTYLIFENKTYPVGTYFSEEESITKINELYNILVNL